MTGSTAGNRKVKSPEAHGNSGSMTAGHRDGRSLSDSTLMLAAGGGLSTCALVACMVPGRSSHPRLPPAWSPEMEHQYSFSTWSRDILIWSIATDGDASRKAASVISQLQGSAREFSRTLPPQTILTGGTVNGTQTDPLTFLMYQLSTRFARLGEEVRLGAVGDLLSFGRESNERIDMLLTRFDTTRMRAAETGGLALSYAGLSWLLIRAVGVSDSQLIQLLQPLGGALPADEQQFTELKGAIRRMGRIIENAPGNMSNMLRGRQNPTHSYHIQDEHSWNENVFTSQNDQPSSSWHDQSSWQSQWHSSEAYPTYTQPQDPHLYTAARSIRVFVRGSG